MMNPQIAMKSKTISCTLPFVKAAIGTMKTIMSQKKNGRFSRNVLLTSFLVARRKESFMMYRARIAMEVMIRVFL